jgi:alpha-tubulin suppressor-like RCC1 family protein/ferric-dicitrate binding protein FerR (iron transport regulator)
MNELYELIERQVAGEATREEQMRLCELLQDKATRTMYVRHVTLMATVRGICKATDHESDEVTSMKGPAPVRRTIRWYPRLLALAASLTVVAGGVWWVSQPQAGSLELRVVEVRGTVSGFRVQGSGGPASGVIESPSHQVAKTGEGMNAQQPTPNAQHPSGDAGATLDTRHATLRVGDVLRPGDGVEVGANGYAKLVYPDRTQVELQQNTRLRVTLGEGENKDAKRLALDGGKFVCSAVPQKKWFDVKTPHAVVRVVGTRFSLGVTEAESRLMVQEGKVALIQGEKSLLVSAGESATATEQGMEMVRDVVYAWGRNNSGQLGNGTTNDSPNPVPVPGLDGVMAVAGGLFGRTVALKSDGTVWTWGGNSVGQLGDGTTTDRLMAGPVPGLSGIVAIAAGGGFTVALKNDGQVFAWGWNSYGQLGEGSTNNRAIPVPVPGLSDVMAIAAGDSHTVALKNDQTVWAWGRNDFGELGAGTRGNNRLVPVQVKMADGTPLGGVRAIAAGNKYTVALKSDGTVWVWGGGIGEAPGSSRGDRLTPMPVKLADGSQLSGIIAVAAGLTYTVALKADGTVWGWGGNQRGELGSGVRTSREIFPVQAKLSDGSPLSGITAIATGRRHTLARKDDGTLWAWGANSSGQLGDGTVTKSGGKSTPVQVKKQDGTPLGGIIAIAAGESHTVAVGGE